MIYFDYAATTPLHPKAAQTYTTLAQNCYGNTSSLHDAGGQATNLLTYARNTLATYFEVPAEGFTFTGSGTESNLLAIISLALAQPTQKKEIITSLGEHPSVDSALEYLRQRGYIIHKVPFTSDGIVNIKEIEQVASNQTALITVQHSNPEIGTIQPLQAICEIAKKYQIPVHSDFIQSFGKLPLHAISQLVDAFSLSAHKIYGPKGVGACFIHPKHRVVPIFPGLVQESGLRGGTVDVPAIAAFTTALQENDFHDLHLHYSTLRRAFFEELQGFDHLFTFYTGTSSNQLPSIIGMGVQQLEGQWMMLELNRHGFAVSTGSACQVGQQNASKVMLALQVSPEKAREFIRISFGQQTTEDQVRALAKQILAIKRRQDSTKATQATVY